MDLSNFPTAKETRDYLEVNNETLLWIWKEIEAVRTTHDHIDLELHGRPFNEKDKEFLTGLGYYVLVTTTLLIKWSTPAEKIKLKSRI
jgi:hypothetical protein